jgi:hypothetical protein
LTAREPITQVSFARIDFDVVRKLRPPSQVVVPPKAPMELDVSYMVRAISVWLRES